MITYADSSVLVAWFHADDEFALPVTKWVQEEVTDFIWNPVLRLEVRHNQNLQLFGVETVFGHLLKCLVLLQAKTDQLRHLVQDRVGSCFCRNMA